MSNSPITRFRDAWQTFVNTTEAKKWILKRLIKHAYRYRSIDYSLGPDDMLQGEIKKHWEKNTCYSKGWCSLEGLYSFLAICIENTMLSYKETLDGQQKKRFLGLPTLSDDHWLERNWKVPRKTGKGEEAEEKEELIERIGLNELDLSDDGKPSVDKLVNDIKGWFDGKEEELAVLTICLDLEHDSMITTNPRVTPRFNVQKITEITGLSRETVVKTLRRLLRNQNVHVLRQAYKLWKEESDERPFDEVYAAVRREKK